MLLILSLALLQEGMFHPKLPSLRRMDMDTTTQKLPDEHCRTTTSCGPSNDIVFRIILTCCSLNFDLNLNSGDFKDANTGYFTASNKSYSGSVSYFGEKGNRGVTVTKFVDFSLQRITETGRSLSRTIPDYPAGVTHSQPGHHPYVLRYEYQ